MSFNVLIVDDSETMRAVIRKAVTLSGVPVNEFREAGNGLEALAILEEAWMDVVLTDINMPEMGGMELLRAIKTNRDLENVPVIFISTESSEIRKEEAARLGVAAYVKKPFLPETIRTTLLDVLNKAYEPRMAAVQGEAPSGESGDEDF